MQTRLERESQAEAGDSPSCVLRRVEVAGRRVEVLALPPIFDLFRESGKIPSAGTSIELMESVSVYNSIPAEESASWKEVIEREYAAYFAQKAG